MSEIPEWVLQVTPYGFSIALICLSWLQSTATKALMIRTIEDAYPRIKAQQGVSANIAEYAADISLRSNFYVATLTSVIAGMVIGFGQGSVWFAYCSIIILITALSLIVWTYWKYEIGSFVRGKSVFKRKANYFNWALVAVNGAFIVALVSL